MHCRNAFALELTTAKPGLVSLHETLSLRHMLSCSYAPYRQFFGQFSDCKPLHKCTAM